MQNVNKKSTLLKRVKSMLKVDMRRAFLSPFFYVVLGVTFVVPILILVMTTMTEGNVSVDQSGNQAVMQSFENVWQIIGSTSGSALGGMDILSMCNIDMSVFAVAVLVCVFVTDDFRSGYSKNIFTVRAKKNDYVISKNVVSFICSAAIVAAFFIGAIIGGGVAGLSFETDGFTLANLAFCLLSKIALTPIFISIFTLASVVAKQKTWLALCLALGSGMLLFMMIPSLTPLDATVVNVVACLIASVVFSVGLGYVSKVVLDKTPLV